MKKYALKKQRQNELCEETKGQRNKSSLSKYLCTSVFGYIDLPSIIQDGAVSVHGIPEVLIRHAHTMTTVILHFLMVVLILVCLEFPKLPVGPIAPGAVFIAVVVTLAEVKLVTTDVFSIMPIDWFSAVANITGLLRKSIDTKCGQRYG